MPQHKSCKKRVKTSAAANERNRAYRSEMRKAIKAVRTEKTREAAEPKLRDTLQLLDRVASKGIIKANTAARYKSRLTLHVAKLG